MHFERAPYRSYTTSFITINVDALLFENGDGGNALLAVLGMSDGMFAVCGAYGMLELEVFCRAAIFRADESL